MIRIIFLILCLGFLCSVVFPEDGLVAIVNKEVVTQKDLDDFVSFMRMQFSVQYSEEEAERKINEMLSDLIKRLIEDRLIMQAANKEDIVIDPMRIKARVEQIKRRYPSEADFKAEIEAQGMSLGELELKIKEQLLMAQIIDRKIKSKVVVKPQEVTDYYNAHAQEFIMPERRLVRAIIINDSSLVDSVKTSISEYRDLEAISREHSLEINELGWVISRQLKSGIADIVFDSEAGSLRSYLDPESGSFYILEVESVKPPEQAALAYVQDEIYRLLFEKKMQEEMVKWLDELRAGAYIEIRGEYGGS